MLRRIFSPENIMLLDCNKSDKTSKINLKYDDNYKLVQKYKECTKRVHVLLLTLWILCETFCDFEDYILP